jgi:low affinity Fe/Cu permease
MSGAKTIRKKNVTLFERAAGAITEFTGSSAAFIIAALLVVMWAATGPLFDYSETWQLVINTGTTIITFLMVFIIQHSQNKDTIALQLKLNELIIAVGPANNELVDAEHLCEEDLQVLRAHYEKIADPENLKRANAMLEKHKGTKSKTKKQHSKSKK